MPLAKGLSIANLASEEPTEEEKAITLALENALEHARAGPGVFRRSKRGQAPAPWAPPTMVFFEHPEHGPIQIDVATGEVAERPKDEEANPAEIQPIADVKK